MVEIDDDVATALSADHESARGPGAICYRNHKMVFDRLKRAPGGWHFSNRTFK